jgi:hypothetical protein
MILQPPTVSADAFEEVRHKALEKAPAVVLARLETFNEGRCAQLLHVGPYSTEGANIERLSAYIESEGLRKRGKHHEIYLGDPRRTDPAKLKTVLRQPVE